MYYPSKEEFINLAKKGNLIPVYREILADFETPLSAFAKIEEDDFSFLLESVEGGEKLARFSFLGSRPTLIFSAKGRRIEIREKRISKSFVTKDDPIDELKKMLSRYKFVKVKGLPRFSGGLVGLVGYDMVRFIEEIPDKNPDDLKMPDALFMMASELLVFDHVDRTIKVVSNVHVTDDPSRSYDDAVRKIDELIRELKPAPHKKDSPLVRRKTRPLRLKSNLSKLKFEDAVRKAKEYIRKGDVIQVVLSQRFSMPIRSDPFQIYRALRSINPSPYMFYLKLGGFHLVGSSPETMVRCEDGTVSLRPIAGTRPRGGSEEEDAKLKENLISDPKERAEHIMLVDLGRNDIGRVCEYNSIQVRELMVIEKYSHVMHIVSDVTGKLRQGKDIFDVLKAAFPAGTVAGAPKVRAMEIIDELENVRRGPYAGCVGYFSFSGNMDTCITIRTILIKDGMAYIQAGAGIVSDSKPEAEYKETVNKAKAMLRAIKTAETGLE